MIQRLAQNRNDLHIFLANFSPTPGIKLSTIVVNDCHRLKRIVLKIMISTGSNTPSVDSAYSCIGTLNKSSHVLLTIGNVSVASSQSIE